MGRLVARWDSAWKSEAQPGGLVLQSRAREPLRDREVFRASQPALPPRISHAPAARVLVRGAQDPELTFRFPRRSYARSRDTQTRRPDLIAVLRRARYLKSQTAQATK